MAVHIVGCNGFDKEADKNEEEEEQDGQ